MNFIVTVILMSISFSLFAKDNEPELAEACINETSLIVIDLTIDLKGQVTEIEFVCDNPKGLYESNKESHDKAFQNWKFKENMEAGKHRYILYID